MMNIKGTDQTMLINFIINFQSILFAIHGYQDFS